MARAFAKQGANLVILARRIERLEEIKKENTKLKNTNELMVNSTSWTITRPLRLLSNKFKKFLHK